MKYINAAMEHTCPSWVPVPSLEVCPTFRPNRRVQIVFVVHVIKTRKF
jgi:hypothetical protein